MVQKILVDEGSPLNCSILNRVFDFRESSRLTFVEKFHLQPRPEPYYTAGTGRGTLRPVVWGGC